MNMVLFGALDLLEHVQLWNAIFERDIFVCVYGRRFKLYFIKKYMYILITDSLLFGPLSNF